MKTSRTGFFALLVFGFLAFLGAGELFFRFGLTQKHSFRTQPDMLVPPPLDVKLEWLEGPSFPDLRRALAASPQGLIVNFWATWCAPCLDEIPSLALLSSELKKQPAELPQILAISVDSSADPVRKLFHQLDFPLSMSVALDPEGKLARTFGTSRFPETYWLSSDGTLQQKWIGPQNWVKEEIVQLITKPVARGVK